MSSPNSYITNAITQHLSETSEIETMKLETIHENKFAEEIFAAIEELELLEKILESSYILDDITKHLSCDLSEFKKSPE